MNSTIVRKKCKCEYCGGCFEMISGAYNRSVREQRKIYCCVQHAKLALEIDLTGKRVGRLIVIQKVIVDYKNLPKWQKSKSFWLCKCDCGNERIVLGVYLKRGDAKSCGCHSLEKRYGQTKYPEYSNYKAMLERCYNPENHKYPDYGGRGIYVCDRWLGAIGFKNFMLDMGGKPSMEYSLDRFPNNDDGIYEPSNCRWATNEQQARNKRNNRWIEYNGERKILQDWATFFKVSTASLHEMIQKGKSFEDVYNYHLFEKQKSLIEYNGIKMNKTDWAKFFKVTHATLSERILNGQTFEFIFNFYRNKNDIHNNKTKEL